MWQFGGCLNEIGIVIDASGAYKGKTPRCGREGVVSGMMFSREREITVRMVCRTISDDTRLGEGTVGKMMKRQGH